MSCSHDAIATAIFYRNKWVDEIQCKCSHGAVVTMTLNHLQPITSNKYIVVAIVSCEQPLIVTLQTHHSSWTVWSDLALLSEVQVPLLVSLKKDSP